MTNKILQKYYADGFTTAEAYAIHAELGKITKEIMEKINAKGK